MFNAFISQDREFIDSMFQEILTDFPYVREIRIVERPSGMTMEKDYTVSMKNEGALCVCKYNGQPFTGHRR
jgi:TolB-like protein